MKKAIALLLASFVGLFGYRIVDETIESRVSELEQVVSSQQEEISNLKATKTLSIKDLKVGDVIECENVDGPFDWIDDYGHIIHIDKCELVLRKIGTSVDDIQTSMWNDSDYSGVYRHTYAYCFEFISTGSVDPKYAGYAVCIEVTLGSLGWGRVLNGVVQQDGSFKATSNTELDWNIYELCSVSFYNANMEQIYYYDDEMTTRNY